MEALKAFLAVTSAPIRVLNMLGGIAAGIWLAILGSWGIIGWGFGGILISTFLLTIITLPGLIFDVPTSLFLNKGVMLGFYVFNGLNVLFHMTVITAWCWAVFVFFVTQADFHSLVPTLLWAYGVATAPLGWMAIKGGGLPAKLGVMFAQLAFAILILFVIFHHPSFRSSAILFGSIMVFGTIVIIAVTSTLARQSHMESTD